MRPSAPRPSVVASLVSLALLAGCGGGKAQDPDWYYHFACNGDSACLTTNPLPNGTAFGTIDEGPVESSCRALQEFRRRFWGTVSWDDCDHCPSCLPPGYGQPTVTGVSPPSEAPGGQVTITGTSFPALASQLEIDVAGAATITTMTPGATISTSGYTTITFTIPPNTPSATGPITVHTPGGVVTWAGPFTVRNDLAAVAWTGAQFVAVGKNASALTSADGTSGWTAHPTGQNPLAVSFTSVASLGGHLLAGGTNARILGSSDGAAWSVVAIPVGGTYSWNGLAYSGTTYVAVGMGGGLATSPDGTTWTSRAFGLTSDNYYGATWASGKFVAIGGGIATSPDASTWTRQVAIGVQNNAVAWSGSAFVAVGSGGAVKTSPDGVTWTTQSSGASANLRGVTWFNGAFIAVGDSGTILTSPDGVTWTARTSGVTLTLNAVAASPTRAVAVGAAGTILWSPDGAAWFAVGLPAPTGVYAAPGQGPGGAPRIHWSAVPGAADYAVYGAAGATVSRTSYQAFSYTTATSADPIGLPSGQPGAWWSFIVVARNGLGESQPSAIVTACVGNTACP